MPNTTTPRVFILERKMIYGGKVYAVEAIDLATGEWAWRGCSVHNYESAAKEEKGMRWTSGTANPTIIDSANEPAQEPILRGFLDHVAETLTLPVKDYAGRIYDDMEAVLDKIAFIEDVCEVRLEEWSVSSDAVRDRAGMVVFGRVTL